MGRREDVQFRLTAIAASLHKTARENANALGELASLLVRSRIDDPSALTPRALSVERATWFAPENVATASRSRLDRFVEAGKIEEAPSFRVFRRESPVSAPMLDLATPSWGRGARAQHSVGPLRGADGRLFWFDFFPLVKLAALHFAGDAQPAILFLERPHTAVTRPTDQHTLVKSSIWIRANLLAPTAPAGTVRWPPGRWRHPHVQRAAGERGQQIHHGGRVDLQCGVEAVAEPCGRCAARPRRTGCGRCATDHS